MSVQDIVNNNPNAYDPMNGEYAPEQIAQDYKQEQQQKDVSGLNMNIVNPSSFNDPEFEKKRLKAAEQFKNGGLPFTAPDEKQTLEDMMGGFLFGGAIALLIGAAAPVAIGIGLLAANSNRDTDTAMQHRMPMVREMYKQGIYSDDALWQYMTTGNNQLLQQERTEQNKREDAQTALQNQETLAQWTNDNITKPNQERQHDYRMQEIAARPLGRLRASGGLSDGIGLDSNDDARAQTILARNYDTMTGKEPTQRAIDWAKAHMAGLNGVDPSKQLFTITGTHKDDMSAEKVLNDFSQNYRKANTDLHKAQQADARMNAVDTSTPIGQVAAAYQFLTVEAPTISNTVATATGVSDEAVNTWSDKIQQILQKGSQAGSFTEQEISDMKYAAQQETKAMHDMAVKAAAQIAQGFNMKDVKTATAVSAATGIPASEILAYWNQIGYEQGEPETSDSSTSSSSNKTVDFTSLPK
ncbi:hypothetical protein J3T26_09930 [Salmonella enterica]|uniref:hypothetical protein n=1 Tax=Salmonella enterica TaxID=28901 RepID=UPI0021D50346|nr:hypothetical protein [Salmonella enterica]MCU7121063.1 hypothetical protein [Salmonella enterica]